MSGHSVDMAASHVFVSLLCHCDYTLGNPLLYLYLIFLLSDWSSLPISWVRNHPNLLA